MATCFDELLGGEPEIDLRSEKAIQNDTLVALYRVFGVDRCLFWRENTGTAWQGKKIKHDKDVLVLAEAHPIKFGLEGIADIMGHCDGLAIAIEMKDAVGRQRTAQQRFQAAWTRGGGVYIMARTVQQAIDGVRAALADYHSTKS
jgi:hypothetical protein